MSYCVNCGVDLEKSLDHCPLCNTVVINPNETFDTKVPHPYPQESGQVEVVKKKDLALFITIVLSAASICTFLLNLLVFTYNWWSLLVIGVCVILFVLFVPAFIYTKLPIYISLLFDGLAVVLYLYFITFITSSTTWFLGLAVPIVALVTLLVLIFVLLLRSFPVTILTTGLYFFAEMAILCIGLELLIDHYLGKPPHLFWSAVVLTVCVVIVSALITLLSRRRLREAVRRRLHF